MWLSSAEVPQMHLSSGRQQVCQAWKGLESLETSSS